MNLFKKKTPSVGGKRKGAGRPKARPTKVVRVPIDFDYKSHIKALEVAKEALDFYAHEESWEQLKASDVDMAYSMIDKDRGETAAEALAEINKMKEK